MPDFSLESRHCGAVAGVDEAGRGCLAGLVVAAAVIFPKDTAHIPAGINDSKKLGKPARERLYDALFASAAIGIGSASVEEIDRLNILQASLLAMQRAVAALPLSPAFILVDGNRLPCWEYPSQAVVDGDALSLSIAAASIIAKVTRDRLMAELAATHPGYGWERNAGYGTATHRAALAQRGITPHHRRTFAPVAQYVCEEAL